MPHAHARRGHGHFRSGIGALGHELKAGKLKKVDVRPRLAQLRDTLDQ